MTSARLAEPADVPAMARSQMRAFADDPLISWMLPEDDFERRATVLFDALLRAGLTNGHTYTTDDAVCSAIWAPPGRWAYTDDQLALLGEPFVDAAGDRAIRALGVLEEISSAHLEEPHWYLGLLGTHPDWQRRGCASVVLAPILARCDAEQLPAYLETQKESNVPFYRRHGFEVTRTLQLTNGAPKLWLMRREPLGPTP